MRLKIGWVFHWQAHCVQSSLTYLQDFKIALNSDRNLRSSFSLLPLLNLCAETLQDLFVHDFLVLWNIANLSIYNHWYQIWRHLALLRTCLDIYCLFSYWFDWSEAVKKLFILGHWIGHHIRIVVFLPLVWPERITSQLVLMFCGKRVLGHFWTLVHFKVWI